MDKRDVQPEDILNARVSTLIADLREAHQHLQAAAERLREWRQAQEGVRRPLP